MQQALAGMGGSGGVGGDGGGWWSLLALEAFSLTQYEEVVVLDSKVRVVGKEGALGAEVGGNCSSGMDGSKR